MGFQRCVITVKSYLNVVLNLWISARNKLWEAQVQCLHGFFSFYKFDYCFWSRTLYNFKFGGTPKMKVLHFFYFNFHKSEHVDPYTVSKKLYQVCLHCWNSCTSFGPLAVAGRVLWVMVCLSVLPSFHSSVLLPGKFLGIGSLAFSSWQSQNFCEKKKLAPKVGQK